MARGMRNGFSPSDRAARSTRSEVAAMRGTRCGYGAERGGSVGSTPASPATFSSRSASV